jgi:hypothetical protein
MHAVVATVKINDIDAASAELREQVVPGASAAPGFVAGYWVALPGDIGASIVVFDTEASAKALAANVTPPPESAVTLQSVEVGEVMGHA